MVWPLASLKASKVAVSSGAEPEDEEPHVATGVATKPGGTRSRTYSVGTPMNTVASGRRFTTAAGSNLENQIILLPFSSAPCEATKRPWM